MRDITFSVLTHTRITFTDPEVFAESWMKRKSFALYKEMPRPTSALFFLCSAITATFLSEDAAPVVAHGGDVVYIPEGAQYYVRVSGGAGGKIDSYTVNFRLLDESGERLRLSPSIAVVAHAEESDSTFALRAAALERAVRQDGAASGNLLRTSAAFYSLLDAVAGAAEDRSDAYYPIRIGVEALRAEWNKNERIETYARLCGVSNAYFYRCFREWSGKSPVEYRNLMRLGSAETMLRYTDMAVAEISEFVGYDDPFYFCRIFTKQYGASPQNYRKAFRQA